MVAAHPRVIGYLGRALSLELSAVQQYMTQASLLEIWGDTDAAERLRQETVEEMRHAERLVQRMLQLGVAPAASQLRPVGHAADLEGLLRLNAVLEEDLIQHYGEAMRFCLLIGDGNNASFFRALRDEEQQHGEDLAVWIGSLATVPSRALQRATF